MKIKGKKRTFHRTEILTKTLTSRELIDSLPKAKIIAEFCVLENSSEASRWLYFET